MKTHLHFTFGPVQGFVAQARRTRDLYAGSLLLSHLATAAMRGAASSAGKIILPDFVKLTEIEGTAEHATAPNRFVAEFDSEITAAEAGRTAEKALCSAWQKIADAVRQSYLQKHVALGKGTAEIWQRQVENFWNIVWVVGPADETDLLDRRKNWQTHFPPAEGGDHCVLMHQWQELSGFIRSKQHQGQDDFWTAVRGGVSGLDLEEGERLCAIAFIKRFFASVAEQAIGRRLNTTGWPSTVTIAALPWMRKIKTEEAREVLEKAKSFAERVAREPGALPGSAQRIKLLSEFPSAAGDFAKLSGNFLNHSTLANSDDTPLCDEARRSVLLEKLRELEKATDDRAGNFYAVLLMDGDNMGKLIGQHGPTNVTAALTKFASDVPGVVAEYDGLTVYAGGDDLLAILPLDRALDTAVAAHRRYVESFDDIAATISAAIVFAHYRCTFSRVLASAHELLDVVAKDRTGRDSLAIRVLKPGGPVCEWSAPFNHFVRDQPHIFAALVKHFHDGKLGASLLYNLRDRFSHITEGDGAAADREKLLKLFTAEALIGKPNREDFAQLRTEMNKITGQLLDVSEMMRRNSETKTCESTGRFTFDGPRLVKFLALDGNEGSA